MEIDKLITMAIASKEFQRQLLTNPSEALAKGYNGQHIELTSQDKELILGHNAATLEELAQFLLLEKKQENPTIVITPDYPMYVDSLASHLQGFNIETSSLPLSEKVSPSLILLCLAPSTQISLEVCVKLMASYPNKLAILTDIEKCRLPRYFLGKVTLISLKEEVSHISGILQQALQHPLCSPQAAKQIIKPHEYDKTRELTRRENEVLTLLDLPNPEIANNLSLSVSTVRKHIQNINEKLGFNVRRKLIDI